MRSISHLPGLPPTEQLLVEGGDERIALRGDIPFNEYGCAPKPDPDLGGFGSSTASVVSAAAFAAAEHLRGKLLPLLRTEPNFLTYARHMNRVRGELSRLCGVGDLPGLEVVFAASGTELHAIAAQLCASAAPAAAPMLVVGVDPAETGRGVPAALAGPQWGARTASAKPTGERVAGTASVQLVSVALRERDGTPRAPGEVDAEFTSLAVDAAKQGRRVLVVGVDVSKTGLIAPSAACLLELQRRLPNDVDVLVDACQFRIAPLTLRAYLERGFLVALTGSKFVGGPSFSGALFIASSAAARLRARPLAPALRYACVRADWPPEWQQAAVLAKRANFGLLLRWEAALEELRRFRSVPDEAITGFLRDFACAVQGRLASDRVFEPMAANALDRRPLVEAGGWDAVPTVFPFSIYRTGFDAERVALSRDETVELHRMLRTDMAGVSVQGFRMPSEGVAAARFQLGHPVACGTRRGVEGSALRLCASAPLVVEACAPGGRGASEVIASALAALDKIALLVDPISRVQGEARRNGLGRREAA